MNAFEILDGNKFVQTVLQDSKQVLSEINDNPSTEEMPDEHQYYVRKVGFCLAHTLTWCKQLDLAIELLANYDYSGKTTSSRADHLIYNIENYLIRLNSVYDRILQITNAVFHIGTAEDCVSHSVIISNHRVTHRPTISKKVKVIKKFLEKYAQERHTLLHKHSYFDTELRKIEMLYLPGVSKILKDDNWKGSLKHFRAKNLRDYLAEKKTELSHINARLSSLINVLFESLLEEYDSQKYQLK